MTRGQDSGREFCCSHFLVCTWGYEDLESWSAESVIKSLSELYPVGTLTKQKYNIKPIPNISTSFFKSPFFICRFVTNEVNPFF